jgi:hypothetical protein
VNKNSSGLLLAALRWSSTALLVHDGAVLQDIAHRIHHLLVDVASNPRDAQAVLAAIALAEMSVNTSARCSSV